MGYINASKGGIIAFIIILFLTFVLPNKEPGGNVEIILTISTFLFAIFSGFFISRLSNRYDQIKDLIAEEDAYWLSIYQNSHFFSKDFVDKVRNIIDKYYIVAFDFDLGAAYKHNAKYMTQMYDELKKVKFPNNKAADVFDDMTGLLSSIELVRNKCAVHYLEKLSRGQWSVLFALSAVILYSLYYLRGDDIYSQVITVLLATILILVLLITRDLINFRLYGKITVAESGQEIFDNIGKLRYCIHDDEKEFIHSLPPETVKYRLGLHEPGQELKIKTINKK